MQIDDPVIVDGEFFEYLPEESQQILIKLLADRYVFLEIIKIINMRSSHKYVADCSIIKDAIIS